MIAMVDSGVSTIVSSCDAALRPSVMRAVGSTMTADGRWVTVYLAAAQSRQLLQDIAGSRFIAAVFSQPSTHRSLQVKSYRAQSRSMNRADQTILARYLVAMQKEIAQVGFPAQLAQAMLAHSIDDVVAIEFEPVEAFIQTPGPKAGTRLVTEQPGDPE